MDTNDKPATKNREESLDKSLDESLDQSLANSLDQSETYSLSIDQSKPGLSKAFKYYIFFLTSGIYLIYVSF